MVVRTIVLVALLVLGAACVNNNNDNDDKGTISNSNGHGKVDDIIHKYFAKRAHNAKISSLLVLKDEAVIPHIPQNATFQERGEIVFAALSKHAKETQETLITFLSSLPVTIHQRFTVVNMVEVEADYSTILTIASSSHIKQVHSNFAFRGKPEKKGSPHCQGLELGEKLGLEFDQGVELGLKALTCTKVPAPTSVSWNLKRIKASAAWTRGTYGVGVVVASADTGVNWGHPALLGQYRGWNGQFADHSYNWFDAIRGAGPSSCPYPSSVPCDGDVDDSHGTHSTGVMVGYNKDQKIIIGVAPKAQWIACRNMDDKGEGKAAWYIGCLDYFLAPRDKNGNNPDPAKRPHVINNSYGCEPSEDVNCTPDFLVTAVTNLVKAGQFVVSVSGNEGVAGKCSTAAEPPGIYTNVMTVGNLNEKDVIDVTSSVGPVPGTATVKPDLVAPGENIVSSVGDDEYCSESGTSFASPAVAGAVALLWQNDAFKGKIPETWTAFQRTVEKKADGRCGGAGDKNNIYGWGILNADALTTVTNILDSFDIFEIIN